MSLSWVKTMEEKDFKWYVVHTYSAYENKVKTSLENAVENRNLGHLIHKVEIPMEEVIEIKNGVEQKVARKKYPGYVLVNMILTEESWYVVRNIRGCTGFVGAKSNTPVPLTDEEVAKMGIGSSDSEEAVYGPSDFEAGESVAIISGPMNGFEGKITEVNNNTKKVKLEVQMFGRETPAEADFSQIKKLS